MAALNCHDCFRVVLEQWLIVARSKVRRVLIPIHSLLKRARHFPLLNGFRRYIILWGGGGITNNDDSGHTPPHRSLLLLLPVKKEKNNEKT